MLPATVELLSVSVPPGWTLRAPPLVGASLSSSAERSIVAAPKLMIAPPPTLVAVFCENVESATASVPVASLVIAPPFPLVFPENVAFLTVSLPPFWIAPPIPVVEPNAKSTPSIVTFDVGPTDINRTVRLPLRVTLPLAASIVRLGPANVTGSAVGLGAGSA